MQFDLENPRVHVFNVNVQRELWWRTAVTVGYAGSRGRHLLRSNDVNTAPPTAPPRRPPFIPAGTPRPEHGVLDDRAEEQRRRLLVQRAHRRGAPALEPGLSLQSSYTLSKSEDTTQASTFFSDATNGTTSALPEFIPDYNKGPSDFDIRHNWVLNFTGELPTGPGRSAGAILGGWNLSGIWTMRSGQPLTVFVQPTARARSGTRRSVPASARSSRATRRATARQRGARPASISGSTRPPSCCSRPAPSATRAAATSSARTCARSTSR